MWAALPAHDRSTMDPVMAWCHCSNKPSPDLFYTKWYKQGPRSYAKYESPLHNTIGSVTNEWPNCQPTLYFTTHNLSSSQCSHLLTPHSLLFYLPFVAKSHPRQQNRKAPIINMSTGIDIMSLNVGGLGNCTERKQLFEWIKNKKPDILFLQETHTTSEAETIWKLDWGKEAVFAHGSSAPSGTWGPSQ